MRSFVSDFRRSGMLALCALALSASSALAQDANEHIAKGDVARAAIEPATALQHYDAALAEDSTDYGALWRAAQVEADLAEYDSIRANRARFTELAQRHARAAVRADSTRAEGRFALARILGQRARTESDPVARSRMGRKAHEQAQACLTIDPDHPGCLHVLGVWHATVSALNAFSRRMAATFAESDVFASASWAEAERYLLKAVSAEPWRIAHRLELGRVYDVQDKVAAAKAEFEAAVKGDVKDINDPRRRAEAARALEGTG